MTSTKNVSLTYNESKCIDDVESVPYYYGTIELKETLYSIVEAAWKKISGNYPITIDDFEMGRESTPTSMTPVLYCPDRFGVDSYCIGDQYRNRVDKKGKPDTKKLCITIIFRLKSSVFEAFKFWDANGRIRDDKGNCVTIVSHAHLHIRTKT